MSTGVELLPFFIAYGAFKTLMAGAEALGKHSQPISVKKTKHCDLSGTMKLGYDKFVESIPEKTPENLGGEPGAAEDLYGNFASRSGEMTIKTVMNDIDLLLATVEDYGLKFEVDGQKATASSDSATIVFEKDGDGVYDARIKAKTDDDARRIAEELDDLYMRKVQQRVYENLTSRAASKGLVFESEECCEDNSIVLTYVIGE